jgi:hypothetical protein
MHPAIEAALELQQFLDAHGEKFCTSEDLLFSGGARCD